MVGVEGLYYISNRGEYYVCVGELMDDMQAFLRMDMFGDFEYNLDYFDGVGEWIGCVKDFLTDIVPETEILIEIAKRKEDTKI